MSTESYAHGFQDCKLRRSLLLRYYTVIYKNCNILALDEYSSLLLVQTFRSVKKHSFAVALRQHAEVDALCQHEHRGTVAPHAGVLVERRLTRDLLVLRGVGRIGAAWQRQERLKNLAGDGRDGVARPVRLPELALAETLGLSRDKCGGERQQQGQRYHRPRERQLPLNRSGLHDLGRLERRDACGG